MTGKSPTVENAKNVAHGSLDKTKEYACFAAQKSGDAAQAVIDMSKNLVSAASKISEAAEAVINSCKVLISADKDGEAAQAVIDTSKNLASFAAETGKAAQTVVDTSKNLAAAAAKAVDAAQAIIDAGRKLSTAVDKTEGAAQVLLFRRLKLSTMMHVTSEIYLEIFLFLKKHECYRLKELFKRTSSIFKIRLQMQRKSLSVLLKAVDLALKCIRDHKLEKRFEVEMRHVTITAACTVLCERGFGRDAIEIQQLKVKEMMEIRSELAVEKTQTVADKTKDIAAAAGAAQAFLEINGDPGIAAETRDVQDQPKSYAAKRDGASLSGDEFKRFKAAGSKE
uniref:Uncharacterized protein n=1 Tax=Ditylenchus dipsaci TaxID=166011 RepID=A0A915D360_9BILA